ncbi:MAG: hypothetical protein QOE53_672 [Pseudonocardiales bacterium]|nr:hypothetical protein [Pseudonocardiales bacterium]
MKTRHTAIGLGALALLLTGCASGGDSGTAAAGGAGMARSSVAPGQSMAGMSMTPGQSMAGMSVAPVDSGPSAAALMVCSADIQDQVRTVLKLSAPAPVRSSWQDQLYTCTYTLPMGTMVLSVKQLPSKPAARAYFLGLRSGSGSTEPLLGLGEQAYATKTGIAVVLKDDMTLRVDTTGLPAVFGAQQQRRTDLAYEIASDVLGCWTGDE